MVDAEEDEDLKAILKLLRGNFAQACLKAGDYFECVDNCNKVLKDDPENQKALYRKGMGNWKMNEFDNAIVIF